MVGVSHRPSLPNTAVFNSCVFSFIVNGPHIKQLLPVQILVQLCDEEIKCIKCKYVWNWSV